MAEINKVPAIRFKGFGDAWFQKHLSEIATMKARIGWQGLTKKEYLDSGNFYLITGTDFLDGRIDFKNCHYVNEDRYAQDINIQIKNDDVLITKDGTIGKVAYVGNLDKPATLNAGVFVIRGKDKGVCNLYLYQYLAAPFLLDYAYKQATGGTIKHLNQNVLVKFPVPISNVNEQEQIGSYFQNLDKLISLHQTKVNKLTNLKKAMLEKMFPKQDADEPEIRFKGFEGAWDEDDLGQLSKITTGSSNRVDSGVDGEYTFFDRSDDIRTSNIYLFDCEAVIVAGEGSDFVPKYFIGKFDLHQRTYAIMNFDKLVGKFLYYYIYLFRKHFLDYAVGSTVKSLRLPMFKEMPIKYPNEAEQEKIGSYFYNLDKSITLHQTELEKLTNLKKACLEKMFV